MGRLFQSHDLNQPMLFSPDIRDWLSREHLVYFISEIVDSMLLEEFYESYQSKHGKGAPPVDPKLLLKLLIYGYCKGVRSSRRIEAATFEDVAFRILACDSHPDHVTIARFRSRHIKQLAKVFIEVVKLCQKAGLVKMGHLSLDGTKIKANAKKSKSRHYDELKKSEAELSMEISAILDEAARVDREEDKLYGKYKRGDELPAKLKDRKNRQKIIRDLLAQIEAEAKEKEASYLKEKEEKRDEDDSWMEETGQKIERRAPKNPTGKAVGEIVTSRRNPTDYDSRIMKESQTGGFIQAYNCQAVVDVSSQVIVGVDVENQPNDKQLAIGMMEIVQKNTGETPVFMTADNGYFSERDLVKLEKMGIDSYIPPTEKSKGKRRIKVGKRTVTLTEFMREKLKSKTGSEIYKKRKSSIEPVFGQIKEARRFRSFLLRGLLKVQAEWELMATAHNIMKLHKESFA